MKASFIGCWCHLRIYAVQASHLRPPLAKLTGHDIPVITSNCGCFYSSVPGILPSFFNYRKILTSPDVTFLKLPFTNLKKSNKLAFAMRKAYQQASEKVRGRRYAKETRDRDIAHYHQSASAFGYEALRWFLHDAKNKKVVTIYRLSPVQEEHPEINQIYNQADAVIVSTDYMKQHLVGCGVAPEKLHVIPYGATAKPVPQVEREGMIMFAGSPLPDVKGFDDLARAMKMLKDEGKPIRLKAHGFYLAGEKEWALDVAKREGVEDLIDWMSFQSVDGLIDAYQRSLCSVIPYTAYTPCFPITVAMANGVPVVASDAMGIPEYLSEGGGIMVPARSPEALAGALRKVRDDASLRASLGRKGQEIGKRRFAWEVLAEQTYRVYQQVLGNGK